MPPDALGLREAQPRQGSQELAKASQIRPVGESAAVAL